MEVEESFSSRRQYQSDKYQILVKIPDEQTAFPQFTKPIIFGCFSLNADRTKFSEGPVNLKFCKLPKSRHVQFNLDENLESCAQSEEEEAKQHKETSELTHLIKWIHNHEGRFTKRRPQFVFYRGTMTKLLGTPYEDKEPWKIAAIYKNGTIYIRVLDTPQDIANREKFRTNSRLSRMSAWGHKFEHFMLTNHPNAEVDPVSGSTEECNIVFYSKLGSHDLMYAAEIDGCLLKESQIGRVNPKKHPEQLHECELIELKTTRIFPHNKMPYAFRKFNLRKWWCQSFTVGVKLIIAGLRDDDGVVTEIKTFPIETLPKMAVEWSSTVLFNFLDQLLTRIKSIVGRDESSVYIFDYLCHRNNEGNSIMITVTVEKNSTNNLPNLM